jgi:pyruvate/2-oxoglutarate dehydrogenase complex dihydrolipoamide dehydrogenase (E3) component
MKAAIIAAERGHQVDLYEKNNYLGGQLKVMDHVPFKWTFKEFKDYLIAQVEKHGIKVHLRTRTTPEMIRGKGYDAVLLALGSAPIISDIPGAKRGRMMAPIYAHGNPTIGKHVVVIGGDQIGTETGMYLAENGHQVTVLAEKTGIAEATRTVIPFDASEFYLSSVRWAHLGDTFRYITGAVATSVSNDTVTYRDADGKEKTIQADSIIASDGRTPRLAEAMKFADTAPWFRVIGDCDAKSGVVRKGIRKSMRSAFAAASAI